MATFATVKDALLTYLGNNATDIDVWFQPAHRNVCAFVGDHLLAIWFEVYYSWPNEVDEIRKVLERETVYETLIDLADPLTSVLTWTPNGFRVLPKVRAQM